MRFGIQYALAALIGIAVAGTPAQGADGAVTEDDQTASREQVTGTLIYRERLMLPSGAVAEVSLLDVSRADAPARTLAQQVIANPPPPPIPFVLDYDPADIDERMRYAVRAVIRQQDRLLFTTDTVYPVITRGAGKSADLLLKRVGGPATMPDASLTNTYWKLVAMGDAQYRHASDNREPHLILRTEGNVATGFGGCNNFSGPFAWEASAGQLRFDQLAVTQRACLEGMELEAHFLAALRQVNRYRIRGDALRLSRDDEDLLGFQAVYF